MVNTAAGMKKALAQGGGGGLRLTSLNHISVVCRSLPSSLAFYCDVLGFFPIRRPGSFDFDGAWLFNFGIGVHLLQAEDPESMPPKKTEINPKDNHISFTCESLEVVQRRLKEMGIQYEQRRVEEGGIYVDQLFFHDPDGFMIEVCTCDNLPVIPLDVAIVRAPPACKRASAAKLHPQQLNLPVPVKANSGGCVLDPAPVKASAGGCVGQVVDVPANMPTSAIMTCPDEACRQNCAYNLRAESIEELRTPNYDELLKSFRESWSRGGAGSRQMET